MKYLPSLLCLWVVALCGCAALGLAQPKGFDQQLAEAYGVHTAIAQAATTAVSTGSLTSSEASAVQAQLSSSRMILDSAKQIEKTNPSGASTDLTLATAALTALQTYLNAHAQGK